VAPAAAGCSTPRDLAVVLATARCAFTRFPLAALPLSHHPHPNPHALRRYAQERQAQPGTWNGPYWPPHNKASLTKTIHDKQSDRRKTTNTEHQNIHTREQTDNTEI